MRRSLTVLMSLGLMLGLGAIRSLVAQDEEPASPAPTAEAPQESESKDEPKSEAPAATGGETKADESAAAPSAAPVMPTSPDELPPAVKEKREAALKAVAELIVAAEQAGLVETNLDPPPVLEILVTGRATDKSALESAQGNAEAHIGLVSPESFAAYFTGYAEPPEGLTAQANVRIAQPSEGLKTFYDQRAEALRPFLDAARADQPASAPSGDQPAPTPPADAPVDVPVSPAPAEPEEEMKKEEPKEEPKDESKKEEPQAEEPIEEPKAKEEMKKEEPKAEEPKAEEPKTEEPKTEEPKDEEPKDEPSSDEPKDEPSSDEPKDEPSSDEPKAEEPEDEPSSDEPK